MKSAVKRMVFTLLAGLMLLLAACGEEGSQPTAAGGPSAGEGQAEWRLEIATPPERLDYEEGETFDPAGVVINATLRDGSVVENVPYRASLWTTP